MLALPGSSYFSVRKFSLRSMLLYLLIFPVFDAYGKTSEQLFILHSYSQEYPWTRAQHTGFTTSFSSDTNDHALISTEYLDTKRITYNEIYADFFAEYLQKKYKNYQPELVYVTDDNALNFMLNHIDNIFPKAKVVFSGVNDYTLIGRLDSTRFTGVFEKKETAPNIELLRLIEPNLKEIAVIGDDSNTYRAIEQEIRQQLSKQSGIKISYIANNNIEQIIAELKQRKLKYLFLTTIGAITDQQGNQHSLNETIEHITAAGDFVIISMEDVYLFKGVLGGFVTSGKQQGRSAASLAQAYYKGDDISQIPAVIKSPNLYIFDYRELVRHQLKLPENVLATASILHRPVSFYEKNQNLILAIIFILTLLLLLSLMLFLSLLTRKNKKIQLTSDKISHQAHALEAVKETLTEAQRIAHLGNWEWKIESGECHWSEEMCRILGEDTELITGCYQKLLSYVHDDDKSTLTAAVENALQRNESYDIENRVVLKNGTIKYVRQTGNTYSETGSKVTKLVGTLLDISSMKRYELREFERLKRLESYQEAILDWSQVTYNSIDEALRRATEISAKTLGASRVSIWLYNDSQTTLVCHNLYILNAQHSDIQMELEQHDFPSYFNAIKLGKVMSIHDARTDTRSNEFAQAYLVPNEIFSMLDVPIMYGGEVAGVVCHEQTGETRQWEPHELEFASVISNKVSLSLEVEKRKQIEKALEHQAYHDELTNLPNRNLFMDRLEQAIKLAHRNQTMIAVMFLDLDNFKEINDSFGHAVGDQVLTIIAKKLQSCLRETDTLSRLGGDEYCLIIDSFQQLEQINNVAVKLFNEMQKPMVFSNHELYVTSSIGISIYPQDGETPDTLLRNADAAMYKAKEEGRNSFHFYTEDMTERAFERVVMESNLRRALDQDEFVIYYQPQYDARDQSLIGMEALIRWQHPEMGLVSPAKFIPLAEETGLIVQIDRWVFKTALQQFSHWYKQGYKPGRLALNLAMKQLHQNDLLDFINDVLNQTECKTQWLALEVTESHVMNRPEQAIAVLQKISELGIEIAVDDFGTGYSSLAYLKRLPVNKLKIDQSFVRDVPGDDEDVAIVCAVIALAKSMGLGVIAEGVEQKIQKDFLLQQGCYLIQGYLYGKPMTAEDIEQRLQE